MGPGTGGGLVCPDKRVHDGRLLIPPQRRCWEVYVVKVLLLYSLFNIP